jgi:hypothetical protein
MSDKNCCGACGYPIHATKDKACDWCRQTADRIEELTARAEKAEAVLKEAVDVLEAFAGVGDILRGWSVENVQAAQPEKIVEVMQKMAERCDAAEAVFAKHGEQP